MTTKTAIRSAPRSNAVGDAIKLLADDRKQVKGLLQKYSKLIENDADGYERRPLAKQICIMSAVYASIKEEIFYSTARQAVVGSDLLDEAKMVHASPKDLTARIRDMSQTDNLYNAKFTALGGYIDHHVKEEKNKLFPKCVKSSMDSKAIGTELATRKQEITKEMSDGMASMQ